MVYKPRDTKLKPQPLNTDDLSAYEEYLNMGSQQAPVTSEQYDVGQDQAKNNDLSDYEEYLRLTAGGLTGSQAREEQLIQDRKKAGNDERLFKTISGLSSVVGAGIGTAMGGGHMAGFQGTLPPVDFKGKFTQGIEDDLAIEQKRRAEGLGASKELMGIEKQRRDEGIEDQRLVREEGMYNTEQTLKGQTITMNDVSIEDQQSLRDPNSEISQSLQAVYGEKLGKHADTKSAYDIMQMSPEINNQIMQLLDRAKFEEQMTQSAIGNSQTDRQMDMQKNQFNQKMEFDVDRYNAERHANTLAMEESLSATEKAAKEERRKIAADIVKQLPQDQVFKDLKADAGIIKTMYGFEDATYTNVQAAIKAVQTYESLLRTSAKASEIADAQERGISFVQGVKENFNDFIGRGNVPTKVIDDIYEAIDLIAKSLSSRIQEVQRPYVAALEYNGLNVADAQQVFINGDFFKQVEGK